MSAALEARGLTVTADIGGAKVAVLRDIDLSLQPGRVLGLVGESGAGKSMIGRVIARNLPAGFQTTAGTLRFGGADLLGLGDAARRALLGDRIAFIPQEPLTALNPVLTIERQFGEHLERLGVPVGERRARIVAALGEVRLREPARLLARYPFQLSGGMCQRVLIAMAFASRPALIVADEPTTALDVSTQAHIVQIMRGMQRDTGTALLFITHDLRLAAHVCDEIMVLYAGDVVERGPARRVISAPMHPYTRALQAAIPALEGPVARLAALPEQMPGVASFAGLPGCRFAPRCATRDPSCVASVPAMIEAAPGHFVRFAPGCLAAAVPKAAAPQASLQTDAAQTPILSLRGVAKHYPGRRNWRGARDAGTDAVRDVDLDVRPGEFVGIVGESGSGKSTLARLIMGLESPSAGRIAIDGRELIARDSASRMVRLETLQLVFQDPQSALNPRRPIDRLITQSMEARMRRASPAERAARAKALLAETGLPPELADRYPAQLSGGQKQRVNIARALCVTPRLLIADEIVSGLDVSVQAQILNLLLDLRAARDIGLLFISHDLAVVRYLCSHVLVMRNGCVVESGPTADIFAAPRHAYTRALLAASPPSDLDRIWPGDVAETEAA
jgi:peptide/nickel transport system ATP-binding protein